MEFAKNVLISLSRFEAQETAQETAQDCVLAVRPVSPSHVDQPQQPIGLSTSNSRFVGYAGLTLT